MTLREARCAFTICLAELILYVVSQGYETALDEGLDRLTEKDPTSDHMKGSLHNVGLAQDLLLYQNGVYLTESAKYQFLGQFWKELGVKKGLALAWGGDFTKVDGNHFSLSWNGTK
jgi:hypothetical protein